MLPATQRRPARPEAFTGVEVCTDFFPPACFFLFCMPRVVIDGVEHRRPWGENFFPLKPGRHTVEVFFRYVVQAHCGYNALDVVVRPGQVQRVRYWMPPWVFAAGSLKPDGVATRPGLGKRRSQVIAWAFAWLTLFLLWSPLLYNGLYVALVARDRYEDRKETERLNWQRKEAEDRAAGARRAEDEARRAEEERRAEQDARHWATYMFLMEVHANEFEKAYARTTAAFQHLHSREAFAQLVRQHRLTQFRPGIDPLPAERVGPTSYRGTYTVVHPWGTGRTHVWLTMTGSGRDWKVDRWGFQDEPR
jgi:hypothetical protein